MHVIASFDHSVRLEMALATLEDMGIDKTRIFAVPLEKRKEGAFFDTIHHSDGKASFDGIALSGAFFLALGSIYGFVLPWGPVMWGIIGFLGGSICAGLVKVMGMKTSARALTRTSSTEVFLIIECSDEQVAGVEHILWRHNSFGVARTS